jgi:hypothetical protein
MTAEELSKKYTNLRSAVALKDLSDFAKEYAKEMIKLDRINVAKHATSKCLNMPESTCSECEYHIIDKSSILNAPQIELL